MNAKAKKRSPNTDRPFPWRCRHCGKQEVVMATIRYDAEVQHDGRLHAFSIPRLEIPACQDCGEKVFTEQVDAQINKALHVHLKLLTAEQIRNCIQRVGMSQKEFANCVGIAAETLSRWLNETQIQSRAMDNLLRVFFAFPGVRDVLCGEDQDARLGIDDACDGDRYSPGMRGHVPGESKGKTGPSPRWPEELDRKREECRPAQKTIQNAGTSWFGGRAA
jgi:putative zinc finger/helix-turn-helix YgiT family protein